VERRARDDSSDSPVIDSIWLKAIIKAIVLPPTGLLLVSLAGLSLRRRFPRCGIAMAWAGIAVLLVLSMPVVAVLLVRGLDASPPFEASRAANAQAIVILGGGLRRNAPEYGGDTLGELTLERVRYGARLAHDTSLPVLVTGGSVLGGETESSLMREALERELDVRVRWTEDRSRTTHENAVYSAAILKSAGIDSVVLVAHSFDMRRATAEFAAAGIRTTPAPIAVPAMKPTSLMDYLPSFAGLHTSYYAVYEILANMVR
jgi:uncharacterized SAM-binding protein YcdF (DUF218 family)